MQKMIPSEKFASFRMGRWNELQLIISNLNKNKGKNLSTEQINKFPEIYRSTCADLAQARMKKLSPDLIEYLNTLVGQAHHFIYSIQPLKTKQISFYLKKTLPNLLKQTFPYVLLSFLIFFTSMIVSGFYIYSNPDQVHKIVPKNVVEMMEESYSESVREGRSAAMSGYMTSYYIQHNSTIAFYSFAAGVLAGLGSIYFLLYNGIFLGAIAGYICSLGYAKNFFTFVLAHSVPELFGLVLAAGAGIYLGFTLIKSTRNKRITELKKNLGKILGLLVTAAFLLVIAALVEGLISGSTVSIIFRVIVSLSLFSLLLFYFGVFPLIIKKKELRAADE